MNEFKGQAAITIRAPADLIFNYLADFPRHTEWVQNVSRITPQAPGPITVGATFLCAEGPPPVSLISRVSMLAYFLRGVFQGAKLYSQARITSLEPYRRIAWQAGIPMGEGYFNHAEWEIVIEPQGQACLITQSFHWQPQHEDARRMTAAAGSTGLEQSCAVNLQRLKRRLEANNN